MEPRADSEVTGDDALLEQVRAAVRDKFDVNRLLGRGGMAVVYLAYDRHLDRNVAIKVLLPDVAALPRMGERFLLEARMLARLHHQNVITVYAIDVGGGLPYFVMPFVDGPGLDRIRDEPRTLSVAAASCVLIDVAQALHHAHLQGVVHRDVKPSNVLLTLEGRAVVTDFGIARAAADERLTTSGMMLGTPPYMSPEQWTGTGEVTGAADQYALGVMAYELFVGRQPFRGTVAQLQWAHVHEPPPPLGETCPPEIADAVIRMLAKDPAARFPALSDVLSVLTAHVGLHARDARQELSRVAAAFRDTMPNDGPPPSPPVPRLDPWREPIGPPAGRDRARAGSRDPDRVAAPRWSLRLSPAVVRLEVGRTAAAISRLVGEDNRQANGFRFEWVLADSSIAQLDAQGRHATLTGLAVGTTTLTVAGAGLRRSVEVIVGPAAARERRETQSRGPRLRTRTGAGLLLTVVVLLAGGITGVLWLRGVRTDSPRQAISVGERNDSTPLVTAPTASATSARSSTTPGETVPLSEAFGFDSRPTSHPDHGDAAIAVKTFLMSIRNHDAVGVRGQLDLAALGGTVRERDTAGVLVRKAKLAGVSLRYDEPRFVRAVYRAVTSGKSSVPFFVVLDDSTQDTARRHRRLYFTAFMTANGASGRSGTEFRLDSISRPRP